MNHVAQLVKAEVFIVPNSAQVFGHNEYWDNKTTQSMAHFGYTPKVGDVFLQIWTVSPDRPEDKPEEWSENWTDHDMPRCLADSFRWPGFFPVSLLPKKEGESVIISTKNHQYELTANQLKYRYQRFGAFDEVMSELINKVQ